MFYKIFKNKSIFYLFKLIPEKHLLMLTRNADGIPFIKIKHNFFKNSFAILEWNQQDPTIWNV